MSDENKIHDAASELVLRRQARRYELLRFVFIESGASEMNDVPDAKIKKELGLTDEEFWDISQYLTAEYLLGDGIWGPPRFHIAVS